MGLVSRFGAWLDRKFPDKVSADFVIETFKNFDLRLQGTGEMFERYGKRLDAIEKDLGTLKTVIAEFEFEQKNLKDDVSKIKAIMQLKQKQTIEMPNLTGSQAWRR